ncbi:MAG: hypothetical protein ACOC4Z_02840 [Patescibacteria group bacterium]
MKKLILATILATLINPAPAFAQETNLIVESHLITVSQKVGEEQQQQNRVEIMEQMVITNQSKAVFDDILQFSLGPTAKEVSAVGIRDEKEQETKDAKVLLQSQTTDQGIFLAKLSPDTVIQPREKREIHLLYTIHPEEDQQSYFWRKTFLYPHKKDKTQLRINPIEGAGYTPQSDSFSLKKEKETGWFISQPMTPKPGQPYSLSLRRSQETEEKKAQETSPEPGPIVIIKEQIRKLIFQRILLTLLINDVLVLGVVFLVRKKHK